MKKRDYRRWTDDERATILREYEAAPAGTKADVLRRHEVPQSTVSIWRRVAKGLNGHAPPPATPQLDRVGWILDGVRDGYISTAEAKEWLRRP